MDKFRNFGFLLKDLTKRYVLRFERHASEVSLTIMQCKVLVNLERSEGASQAKLAELIGMEPMMMVRTLDRMEADNLLERRPDPADRRVRRLYLTKKAKPLLEEIARLVDMTSAEVFAGINKADRDVFMRVLERLHDNCAPDNEPIQPSATAAPPARRARSSARAASISAK